MCRPMTFQNSQETVHERLFALASASPERTFLFPPAGPPVTIGALASMARRTGGALASLDVGPEDRVALVVGDRAMAITSFLAAVCFAGVAPLNVRLTEGEFADALEPPATKLVLTDQPADHPIWAAARRAGRRCLGLAQAPDAPLGLFRIADAAWNASDDVVSGIRPDHVGLVLSTSGTTAKPKRVPLTNRNLTIGGDQIAAWLALGPDDCVLSVMPLFHIHGIIATIMTPLLSGGAIQGVESVSADTILDALATGRSTWSTAVPTIWQALHNALSSGERPVPRHRLRFVRSSSAAMPPSLLHAVEGHLGVPVIEAYGMTEATHQMASNPLPPRERRPGAVGLAAGIDIAIMDGDGTFLPTGTAGEVVIRGASVITGYEDNPDANRKSFTDGWFRTGDEGVIDDAGYLTLTGRLKEMINRGGEKIAPLEVDRVLTEHPAIREAISFAIPHPTLGEDIAAAVVPTPDMTVDEADLRAFLARRLAPFKIPQRLVILSELPKGTTGKPQRVGLAEKLGLGGDVRPAPADAAASLRRMTPLEAAMAGLWARMLGRPAAAIDPDVPWVMLGGDSLLAVQLTLAVEQVFDVGLDRADIASNRVSVADMATAVTAARGRTTRPTREEPIPVTDRPASVGATAAQRLFWNDRAHVGDDFAERSVVALRFAGPVTPETILEALERVAERHEGLRTSWSLEDGHLIQTVSPSSPIAVDRPFFDDMEHLRAGIGAWLGIPLPAAAKPRPWRACLARLGTGEQVLVINFHHIVMDGTGGDLLARALIEEMGGGGVRSDERPAGPADLAIWEDRWWSGDDAEAGTAFWTSNFRRIIDSAPRSGSPATAPDASDEPIILDHRVSGALEERARAEGCSPFLWLMAAFAEAFHAETGRRRVGFTVPLASRTFRHTIDMLGCLIHEAYFVADVAASGGRERLPAALKPALEEALRYQTAPSNAIHEKHRRPDDPPVWKLTELTDVYFQVKPRATAKEWRLGEVTVERLTLTRPVIPTAFWVSLERDEAGYVGELCYRDAVCDRDAARGIVRRFSETVRDWAGLAP